MGVLELVVKGETAQLVWENVQGAEHLLKYAKRRRMRENEAYAAEVQLISYIRSILYGYAKGTAGEQYGNQFEYTRAFDGVKGPRRRFVRLIRGKQPIVVVLEGVAKRLQKTPVLKLGYAWGVTTVVPVTEDGFIRLKRGEISMANLLPDYNYDYVCEFSEPTCPSYLYIGTSINIGGLGSFFGRPDEVEWAVGCRGQAPSPGLNLLHQVMVHIGECTPSLRLDAAAGKITYFDESSRQKPLPQFFVVALRGQMEGMLRQIGFEECGFYDVQHPLGYLPKRLSNYLLELDKINKSTDIKILKILKSLYKKSRVNIEELRFKPEGGSL